MKITLKKMDKVSLNQELLKYFVADILNNQKFLADNELQMLFSIVKSLKGISADAWYLVATIYEISQTKDVLTQTNSRYLALEQIQKECRVFFAENNWKLPEIERITV